MNQSNSPAFYGQPLTPAFNSNNPPSVLQPQSVNSIQQPHSVNSLQQPHSVNRYLNFRLFYIKKKVSKVSTKKNYILNYIFFAPVISFDQSDIMKR